jgi:hypothetical protein
MCRDKKALYARPKQKPRYCGPCCVGKNMIDVRNNKCPCGKTASFGFSGGKAECCKECKKPGMVNVVSPKCPCGKIPSYGFSGGPRVCCDNCKKPGMLNIASKKCQCGHQMSFGFPDEKAMCCSECKEPGMVNVAAKMCSCGKIPSYGFSGEKAVCCSECKEPGMVNVAAKMCQCGKIPSYGFSGGPRECCKECKKPGMVNVVSKTCPGYDGAPCPVITQLTYGREYCLVCDPDDSPRCVRLKDARAFFDFLAETDIDTTKKYSLIDGVIVAADIAVCLELDEDAHEHYDKMCEEARMHDASAELKIAFPDRPIAWIRVNPHIKKDGRRDVSRNAKKVRDERHREALLLIRDVLKNPRDCIEYVGYSF